MITAVLSWYDESPTWLAATVASCARFCDRVVAVDGAYQLYPNASPWSAPEQHEAIVLTARSLGMGATVHVPSETWRGNEIAKRTFLMRAGSMVAEDGWLFVIDADEVVIAAPPKDVMLAELAQTDALVASVRFGERRNLFASDPLRADSSESAFGTSPTRRLYRADATLRVEDTHYRYMVDVDGAPVDLWEMPGAATALDLGSVVIEHRNRHRDPSRARSAAAYYKIRDAVGIEGMPVTA